MYIRRVELENVKSYLKATVDFSPGTNAIIGENGAGKSTILEAIGFALFDHLPYKRSEFVREGEKTATTAVHFVSAADEREYQVVRKSGSTAEYWVYDPELDGRLTQSRDDTLAWLGQHLCLDPDADISSLFKNAIGVQQGLFTTPFLQTPAQRKPIFDPLLRVDEYQKAWDRLRTTERHLENEAAELVAREAGLDAQVSRLPEAEEVATHLERALRGGETTLVTLEQEIAGAIEERTRLERIKADSDELRSARREVRSSMEGLKTRLRDALTEASESEKAADLLEAHRAGHEAYLIADRSLRQLEQDRATRDHLVRERMEAEHRIDLAGQRILTLQKELEGIGESERRIESLAPQVQRQIETEQELEAARPRVLQMEAARHAVGRERQAFDALTRQMSEMDRGLARLEEIDGELQEANRQLANLRDTLEKRRTARAQLEASIQNTREQTRNLSSVEGAQCPVCEGTLTGEHRHELLRRNEQRMSSLEVDSQDSRLAMEDLERRREKWDRRVQDLQRETRGLPTARQREETLGRLGEQERRLRDVEDRHQSLVDAPAVVQDLMEALETLGDPRTECQRLRALTAERAAKESELSDKGILRADLQSRADDTASRLVPYLDLDQRLAASRHERAAHEAAHQGFLENSKVAGLLASRRERAAKIESDLRVAQGEHEGIAARLAETAGLYDAEEYAAVRRRETQLRAEQARLNGQMEVQRQNLRTTEAEIKTLRKAASDLQRVRGELAEARTLHGLVARTRGWLREAGPMVTQLLVDSISHRAANLFSEIMNDYRQRLRWGSDYGIVLEVQGRERSFGQLSGGEQMSASLAVRLAVLGELFGGIDIAFFDEPTANLDENRRSNLADQIMAVKGFSQIFVISHDDTFERATGHFIRVIKENGESHIASE